MATPTPARSFNETDAAAYLGLSRSTLRKGRMRGRRLSGVPTPPYVRLGRTVRYLKDDLDAWLEQYRVLQSSGGG